MPESVTVDKAELLTILRANRDKHRAQFLKAQEGYRARAIHELDRALADARKGNEVRLALSMPVPEDHTEDYDREIRMLEMSVRDEVEIDSHLFDEVVMDRWSWSRNFEKISATYSGR